MRTLFTFWSLSEISSNNSLFIPCPSSCPIRPPLYYVLEEPSPTSGRTEPGLSGLNIEMAQMSEPPQLMLFARLSCTLALLPCVFSFVTLSDIYLLISSPRSCACSVNKQTISTPDKCPKRFALSPHPPTVAHGMTILHAYSNHHLCVFFTSKHPARIPPGTDNDIQRERKSKRCPKSQRIWEEKGYC